MWSRDSFLAFPHDVIAFAWSAPMRDLATRVGISDVGLRKLLVAAGIPLPPQGHWNRVKAGREVQSPPEPGPRRPGDSGRIELDGRFRGLVPEGGSIPEAGPFASHLVPESLDELREQEVEAIGRVTVPRKLDRPHPALGQLMKREGQLRDRQAAATWSWDRPRWDGALAQRQLRIIDAVLKTLGRRGHSAWSRYSQEELEVSVTIGSRHFRLGFGGTGHRGGERAPSPDLPASNKLTLTVDYETGRGVVTSWRDGAEPLEKQIAAIAAGLVVIGEDAFRHGLVKQREWDEQRQRWAEEARRAERKRLEDKRLTDLAESGSLLRRALELRQLVAQVESAVSRGRLAISRDQLERWQSWALREADRVDPVLSGQVLSHLVVPELDEAD